MRIRIQKNKISPTKEEKLNLKTRKNMKISTGTDTIVFSMQSNFRQRTWSKNVYWEKN
jgi:hypothetical protein